MKEMEKAVDHIRSKFGTDSVKKSQFSKKRPDRGPLRPERRSIWKTNALLSFCCKALKLVIYRFKTLPRKLHWNP